MGAGVANAPPPIIFFVCYLEVRAQKEGARFGFFSLLWVKVRFCDSPSPQYFLGNYAPDIITIKFYCGRQRHSL